MSKLARRVVEAIQHSLLGALLFGLIWPWAGLVAWTVDQATEERYANLSLVFVVCMITMGFAAWLIGAIARYDFPWRHRPANGFDVWSQLPDGGLRPPRLLRSIVTRIGAQNPRRPIAEIAFFMGVLAATMAVGTLSIRFLSSVHPLLGSYRMEILCSLLAIMFLATIRSWATAQRAQLSADAS